MIKPFWEHNEFFSIDLYGDELAQPIENFVPIYRKAEEKGLRLKAHIGEWGTADDVIAGIKLLHLNEVQHGIFAVESGKAVEYLVDNKIRLNICPSSNVCMGRVKTLREHPIKSLFRAGVEVTVNSDDVLIFDSDVSNEYFKLYKEGTLSAEELDKIRIGGLKHIL